MRARALQLVFLLLALAAFARAKDESLDALKARATRENQPRLFAEVLKRQVEIANTYYDQGDVEKAQQVVAEIMTLADKCIDAAQKKPDHLKDTELTLYRAAKRLEDVRRGLNLDDQPPVQAAVDRIEKARRNLLDMMFHPEKKDPEKKDEKKP